MTFTNFIFTRFDPVIFYLFALIISILVQAQTLKFNIAISLVLFLSYFVYKNYTPLKTIWVILIILTTFILGQIRYQQINNKFYLSQSIIQGKDIDLKATVLNCEYQNKIKFFPYVIILNPKKVILNNEKKDLTGLITIFCSSNPGLEISDLIEIKSLSIKASNKSAANYLIRSNCVGSAFVGQLKYKLLQKNKNNFWSKICKIKNRLTKNLAYKINKQTFPLFSSIFLGNNINNKQNNKLRENFNHFGISHYLARSGLHVAIIILLVYYFLKFIYLNFFIKQLIMLTLISIYTLLTTSSISFLRSFITFLFYKFCIFSSLPISAIQILSLTCTILLLYNPFELFFLDFQLSFCLTFAIILFGEINRNKLLK